MPSPLRWLDQQTGLGTTLASWFRRPVAGGPAWRFVWPATIVFTFVVQAITGLAIWMYYSPGAQSSWESVYYLQYHVMFGWLLRAIHFYAGQALLVLLGIYLVQMVLRGACGAPRTMLFWIVLLMGLVTLGLNLTGDLLPWDQNSYWATHIRVSYLGHLPLVGPWLSKLAVGGPDFGTLTLTRFLALHVGVFTTALLALILLHSHTAARIGMEPSQTAVPYWPGQAWRDAAACLIVAAAITGLALRNGTRGPDIGIELGAPANLADDPHSERPEWSFRGLFQLHETLARWPEVVSIFLIPGLTVLLFFAMPLIGRNMVGKVVNAVITLGVLGGLAVLTWQSYAHDAKDEKFQAALKAGREQAARIKHLIMQPGADEIENAQRTGLAPPELPRIPPGGALTLLLSGTQTAGAEAKGPTAKDAKLDGPHLFNKYCASCHDYSGEAGITRPEKPTAADLYGFASRQWLTEFLTVKGINSPKYFGNTKFKQKEMYGFIKDTFQGEDMAPEERTQIIAALSHEAELKSQAKSDAAQRKDLDAGAGLMAKNCTDCHTFRGQGTASGPDLTGYGSRKWLIGIIGNAAHKRFYGEKNDRMPIYAESPTDPSKNLLSQHDIELLADWLRGEENQEKK